jgi:diguanylate cyclase (GGDEF)-like protein
MAVTMPASIDLLLFATLALAAAAASLTAFGLRRDRHPGWWWWLAAMWLTTAGAACAALAPAPWAVALAPPLLLQWPLVTLMGLRRFHARQHWPGHWGVDAGLLALASTVAWSVGLLMPAQATWPVVACGLAVHLYAAAVMFNGPAGSEATPVHFLGGTVALLAFAPGLAVLGTDLAAQAPAPSLAAHAARVLAATLGAIVLAFVALTLLFERTERQLRESRRRLRLLANVDALTQVPNRRRFNEMATHALRADPPGSAVLLLFDIDHFKQINDRLGHPAGDRALCLVAGSVLEHLRAMDAAGRHGGDEFVLLLRRTNTQHAMGVAARIVAELQKRTQNTPLPPLSLSFGLVQLRGGEDIDAALRRADQALYEAKRQGRSRAVAASGNEDQPVFSESRPLGLMPA